MTTVRMSVRIRTDQGLTRPTRGRLVWIGARLNKAGVVVLTRGHAVDLPPDTDPEVEIEPGAYRVEENFPAGITRHVLVPDTDETLIYGNLLDIDPATLDPIGPPPVDRWEAQLGAATALATQEASKHAADAERQALAAGGSEISAAESVRLAAAEVLNAAAQVALAMQQVAAAAGHAGDADTARAAAVVAQQGATTAQRAIDQLRPELTVGGLVVGRDLVLRKADGSEASAGQVVPRVLGGVTSRLPFGSAPVVEVRQDGLDFSLDVSVPDGQPGGLPFNTAVPDGTDLNTVTTAGQYRCPTSAGPSLGLNYPVPVSGVLEVIPLASPTWVLQRYTAIGGSAAAPVRGHYTRKQQGTGVWTPWSYVPTSRVDRSEGGPSLYVWDADAAVELAVYTHGTILNTVDLNTVASIGMYRQPTGGNATIERNYPAGGTSVGVLEVIGDQVNIYRVQRWTPYGIGGANGTRVFYMRRSTDRGATWGEWRAYGSQRVDTTVGYRVLAWDDARAAEVMLRGDTGLRDIRADLINGWTASVATIHRDLYRVTMRFEGLAPPTTDVVPSFYTVPSGFVGSAAMRGLLHEASVPAVARRVAPVTGVTLGISGAAAGQPLLYGEIGWDLGQAWPGALPGSPSGGIPYL